MPKCKGCGAEILWVKMTDTGKHMPVDPEPQKIVVLGLNGSPGHLGTVIMGFIPHWASCPKADEFKRR